jgi:2-iminobutanoate/2-iminopropanoate deaminase
MEARGEFNEVMPRETIHTDGAPRSALYAQGVRAGDTIYVSGMVGLDPTTGELAGATVSEQTRRAVANCEQVLAAGGGSLEDVVEVGVLLTDPEDFAEMNEAYAELFATDPPARYVAKLGVSLPDVLVSIRMTAWVGPPRP